MDVWFDSGSSWSMFEHMPEAKADGREHLADVCLEGSDQHRGWFQSQLLTAIGSTAAGDETRSPYGALITHGMVLDEKGRKMSKSDGNIVSPVVVVQGGKVRFLYQQVLLNADPSIESKEAACLWRGRYALVGCHGRLLGRYGNRP